MPITKDAIIIDDLTGGRNGFDPPHRIPEGQCAEARNVDFWDTALGAKRFGASAIGVTFSSGGPFSGSAGSLIRHVPGDDETAAELWAIDNGSVSRFARLAGASTWTQVTLADNLSASSDANNVVGASINGFLFLAYKNVAGNRLHVWDPSISSVRRVGIATPNVPSTAAMGAGALSFTRYYRVRDVDISGSDTRRRSEASAVASITIAAKQGVTVTKGAATGESETHWELEASDTATGPWYRIAQIVVGTTSFNDTNATIPTTNPSPADGINWPPPSAKFIVATDARLVMANSWETSGGYTTPKNNRIWFTPVIGDNDVGDLERIPTGRFLDVEAPITGLAVIGAEILVFAYRRMWRLVPTGDSTRPYAKYTLSVSIGCIRHQSIVAAEDEFGNPCIYFLSQRGPYRFGRNGLQYCGADIQDLWTTNNPVVSCHGVYYSDRHQVWFWLGPDTNPYTAIRVRFDTRRGRVDENGMVRRGWVYDSGGGTFAYSSVMFSNTIGASMSRDLKPFSGMSSAATIHKGDDSTVFSDGGQNYPSFVDTREYLPFGIWYFFLFANPLFLGGTLGGVKTLYVSQFVNFALSDGPSITEQIFVPLSGSGHFFIRIPLQNANIGSVAFRWGNVSNDSLTWAETFYCDQMLIPITKQDARSA